MAQFYRLLWCWHPARYFECRGCRRECGNELGHPLWCPVGWIWPVPAMRRGWRSILVAAAVAAALLAGAELADGKVSHEQKLRNAGVLAPAKVLSVSRNADLKPYRGVAMLQLETGIPQRNIFGCDYGPRSSVPYCNQAVTKSRVDRLRLSPYSNGIGWTQITYKPLVAAYNGLWRKMHRVREQMKVGFRHLSNLIRGFGEYGGFRRYNGSGAAAEAYAERGVQFTAYWKQRGGW